MSAVGGPRLEASLDLASKSFLTHQPGHTLGPDSMSTSPQGMHQAWATISATAAGVDRAQISAHGQVRVWAALAMQGTMKSGYRHCQQATQHPDRIASPFTSDEGVPHLDSLAKNAVAFFKISRSILSVAFSARSRANSASTSLTGLRPGELSG